MIKEKPEAKQSDNNMSYKRERWRWVSEYEGMYQVSDKGRVRRVHKDGSVRVLKTPTDLYGYTHVQLSKNNKVRLKLVHRLVAEAFIDNPLNKPEVNHKNGRRSDNRVQNLEWVTRSENERHAYERLGKKPNKPWSGKPRKFARRLTDDDVRRIRSSNRPSRAVGAEFGVSKTTILNIRNRKIYAEVV